MPRSTHVLIKTGVSGAFIYPETAIR